jgi:Protein of unknown function (DUF3788)
MATPSRKPNAFVGRTSPPSDADVARALGPAKPAWDSIAVEMAGELGIADREWKSYGVKHGWSLRLKRGKRNIVYLAPCQGCFDVLLILGDRAVKAARASGLGRAGTRLLDAAPRYPEGTGVRLQVSRAKDLPLITKLARIKLEN